MKIRNILVLLLVVLVAASCREGADYAESPSNSYVNKNTFTFEGQFRTIWNAVNTGYNFWDVTDVDWDQRYREYMPKFQALDKSFPVRYKEAKQAAADKNVEEAIAECYKAYRDTMNTYYEGVTNGLMDHHLVVYVRNPYATDYKMKTIYQMYADGLMTMVSPAQSEISTRPYRHKLSFTMANGRDTTLYMSRISDELTYKTFRTICERYQQEGRVEKLDSAHFTSLGNDNEGYFIYAQFKLSDGRVVPYYWQSTFNGIIKVLQSYFSLSEYEGFETATQPLKDFIRVYFEDYLKDITTLPKEKMAGAILDVRENPGGAITDLMNMIGQFTGKSDYYWETRHKEGMGRHEMSAWVPDSVFVWDDEFLTDLDMDYCSRIPDLLSSLGVKQYHRDFAADNIPVVCLTDLYSASCAEATAGAIKSLPTGYVIGERTYGGHGALNVSDNSYDINYCGVVGDANLLDANFYIYTSNFENRPRGQRCLEGVGITPNEEVLYNDAGFKGQLEAALSHIANYK